MWVQIKLRKIKPIITVPPSSYQTQAVRKKTGPRCGEKERRFRRILG